MENPETPGCEMEEYNNSDKTFNKLIELQELIKKEQSLKEFCKF